MVLRRDDTGDLAVSKLDDASFGLDSVRTGYDLHRIRPQVVPAHAVRAGFAIAGSAKKVHQFSGSQLIAYRNGFLRRVNFRGVGKGAYAQLFIDQLGKLDVNILEPNS